MGEYGNLREYRTFRCKYPHTFEYIELGYSYTQEGRKYIEIFQDEIWDEHSKYIDIERVREDYMGGNNGIHKIKIQ